MSQVYVVTFRAEESGETRAYVYGENHRDALLKFLDRFPGITDPNTIYIAETQAQEVIQ